MSPTYGMLVVLALYAGTWCPAVYGADILYISPTASPSHHIWDRTLARALRDRHHRITFLTHSPEPSSDNFTTIILEGYYEAQTKDVNFDDFADLGIYESFKEIYEWIENVCKWDMKTQGLKQMMELAEKKTKFDLIIFDMTAGQCLYPLIEKFNSPPVVVTSQFGLSPYYTFHFGIDLYTAYNPNFILPYDNNMNFVQRTTNYFTTMLYLYWRQYVYMPKTFEMAQKYFGKDIRPFDEVEKSVSLLLANYDPVLDYPVPVPPAVIPVGGLHTKREKSVPKDLQKILDESKNGVILFSLGTNLPSSNMRPQLKRALIEAFSEIKETVLWKYETELEGLPKNVIVRPWLPQNDIMAHPNVKLFITHGGGLSTQEAMFHGLPVVGIPHFADQHVNVQKMVTRKLGLSLHCHTFTTDQAVRAIRETIDNPIYRASAQAVSRVYRAQPQDALARAVHWVEFVLRHGHGGARALRIAARDLPWHQLLLLDMWAAILAAISLAAWAIYRTYRGFKPSNCKHTPRPAPKQKMT